MQTAGVWPRLLDAASWAPSPHNTQPWLVHPRSDTMAELYVPAGRTLPYTDASAAFATNALGIFVEALDVAAAAEGLTVEAEPLYPKLGAGAEERPLFARLRLAERSEPPRFPVELLAGRQRARAAYDRRPADGAALAALQAIAGEAGHEAWFTSDRELVDWVVGLNADTLFYDLDDDRTRAEIGRWIRSRRPRPDGRATASPPCHSGFPARSSASSSSTIACSRAGRCEASCAGSTCGRRLRARGNIFGALRAGASGFLLKRTRPEELIAAVHTVARGDSLLSPSVRRLVIDRMAQQPLPELAAEAKLDELTRREREVLELIARGLSNREIATDLFVEESTVRTHVKRIQMKLQLRDRVQIVIFAYETGVNEPAPALGRGPAE